MRSTSSSCHHQNCSQLCRLLTPPSSIDTNSTSLTDNQSLTITMNQSDQNSPCDDDVFYSTGPPRPCSDNNGVPPCVDTCQHMPVSIRMMPNRSATSIRPSLTARFLQSRASLARMSMISADINFPKVRLVQKDGRYNVRGSNAENKGQKYIQDIFTTLVDSSWTCILCCVLFSFLLSWSIFCIIYYATAWKHGDLEAVDNPKDQTDLFSPVPCIMNSRTITGMMLFSLETQHTIGYGYRYITEKCAIAIAATFSQAVCGVLIEACLVAVIIAKLTQPKNRAGTILFSANAVIAQRNGKLCLMFRIGDMRQSHLIDARIRLLFIKRQETVEGEVIAFHQTAASVCIDHCVDGHVFLAWPIVVTHVIDERSPLYGTSQVSLPHAEFEAVVILEGTTESTGITTQARTSYSPKEILWGHRFEPLFAWQSAEGAYKIDYELFNNTYDVPTPKCSAKDLKESGNRKLAAESIVLASHGSNSNLNLNLNSNLKPEEAPKLTANRFSSASLDDIPEELDQKPLSFSLEPYSTAQP